jgi:histidine triad (HIT) family protein
MTGCFTCQVNAGQEVPPGGTVYADDLWIADHGVPALVRGYMVLKPKRHVRTLVDLLPAEATGLGQAAQELTAAMHAALRPERIYVCSFGEAVPHLHFHLLPRYADMPALGPGLLEALFSGEWSVSDREAEEAAMLVQSVIG